MNKKILNSVDLLEELSFLRNLDKEQFYVVFLINAPGGYYIKETKCYTSESEEASTTFSPAFVFKDLLNGNYSTFVMVHNHPDERVIAPSRTDFVTTKGMYNCAKWLGFDMLDSLIIGDDNGYFSFAKEGVLGKSYAKYQDKLEEKVDKLCDIVMKLVEEKEKANK